MLSFSFCGRVESLTSTLVVLWINKFYYWAEDNPRQLRKCRYTKSRSVVCGLVNGTICVYYFENEQDKATKVTSHRHDNTFVASNLRCFPSDALLSVQYYIPMYKNFNGNRVQVFRKPDRIQECSGDAPQVIRLVSLWIFSVVEGGSLKQKVGPLRPHTTADLKNNIRTAIRLALIHI